MRVHHLNCGTMHPPGGRLFDGNPGIARRSLLVAHCLLIETADSLVLVDTGLGSHATTDPRGWLGAPMLTMVGGRPSAEETAVAQIRTLGHDPADVRHIVMTHLDLDHAGGLADFPDATVHVHAQERRAAGHPKNLPEKARYRTNHFAHSPKWSIYEETGEVWFGFDAVRPLRGLPPEILLVPLPGHTNGHAGVAVDTGKGWLLHAGDAYFFHGEVAPVQPYCPPGIRAFANLNQMDGRTRRTNVARLRTLARDHADEVTVFSAHSPVEFQALRRRSVHSGL
ncbi:MBL fold metallo-hydrolase [Amycolatopsis panacis]|uniref:MBL fold metallo-hydrolase n=1 Tax=Amycolatopsis panacis TaxID=2340917 RepID=A0A419I6K9_9PSEU|nr:MBL fold metallo-hydrolase [Amycolatopsis panacis]RJQ87059.1 MBL fold metallo-hydrolase [Amycolatopsis panacis]